MKLYVISLKFIYKQEHDFKVYFIVYINYYNFYNT